MCFDLNVVWARICISFKCAALRRRAVAVLFLPGLQPQVADRAQEAVVVGRRILVPVSPFPPTLIPPFEPTSCVLKEQKRYLNVALRMESWRHKPSRPWPPRVPKQRQLYCSRACALGFLKIEHSLQIFGPYHHQEARKANANPAARALRTSSCQCQRRSKG